MPGISPTGFEAKTFETILSEIVAQQLSDISSKLNLSSTTVFGQINNIMAEKLAEVWELAEDVYNSQYPDTAVGAALENIVSITGVTKFGGTATQALFVSCELAAGTTLPAGSVASIDGDPNLRFTLNTEVINAGPSTVTAFVSFTAERNGPISVGIGELSVIAEPVTGWLSVENTFDVSITGRNAETDNELRLRREQQFALQGSGTLEAIKSAVLLVDGVTGVTVRENTTDVFVGGLLPHSINVIAVGSFADQDMAIAIFTVKGAGIATSGGEFENHTDSQGIVTVVHWDVPTTLDLFIDVDLTFDANLYPSDGDALVAQAVEAYINSLDVGQDVRVTPLACAIIDAVAGVTDIEAGSGVRMGLSSDPVVTGNFIIGPSSQAQTAISQIVVSSTVAVP